MTNLQLFQAAAAVIAVITAAVITRPFDGRSNLILFLATTFAISLLVSVLTYMRSLRSNRASSFLDRPVSTMMRSRILDIAVTAWLVVVAIGLGALVVIGLKVPSLILIFGALIVVALAIGGRFYKRMEIKTLVPYGISLTSALVLAMLVIFVAKRLAVM